MMIALTNPPNTPGIPCKLLIPQVSQSPIADQSLGVRQWNPKVEITPAANPINKATAGQYKTPLEAPIATPPARVAFKISSMINPWPNRELTANVDKQLPVSDKIVLKTIWFWSQKVQAPTPKLKDGQNIQRKRVPIRPKMNELQFPSALVSGLILLLRTRLTVRPKQAPQLWMSMLPPTSSAPMLFETNTSLKQYPTTSIIPIMRSYLGPTLPITPPNEMRTAATQYEALVTMSCSTLMQVQLLGLPFRILSQKGLRRMQIWTMMALMKKVYDNAESAWVLMKVIKNPKPISIITFTSWNTGYLSLSSLSSPQWVSILTQKPQRMIMMIYAAISSCPKVLRELVGWSLDRDVGLAIELVLFI